MSERKSMMYILIAGKKRSGKNYYAELLKRRLEQEGFKTQITAFADTLKDIIAETLGISREHLELYKNNGYKLYSGSEPSKAVPLCDFRQILQRFGTDVMKKYFRPSVWADIVFEKTFGTEYDVTIIPDFRFLIEYNTFQGYCPYTIWIEGGETGDNHISENELNNFFFMQTVDNTDKGDLSPYVNTTVQACKGF